MIVQLNHRDMKTVFVDRDGTANGLGPHRQGLNVMLGGLTIHFEDEEDALKLCRRICERLGTDIITPKRPCVDAAKIQEELKSMQRVMSAISEHFGFELPLVEPPKPEEPWHSCAQTLANVAKAQQALGYVVQDQPLVQHALGEKKP